MNINTMIEGDGMVKKCRIARKTRDKLEWLKYNCNSFSNKLELRRELGKRFNISDKHSWRILKIYDGILPNLTNRGSGGLSGIPKVCINDKECYFCSRKDSLIEHHISYAPETVINLCKGCHEKIHKIMGTQHENEIKRKDYIKNIKNILKNMMESL